MKGSGFAQLRKGNVCVYVYYIHTYIHTYITLCTLFGCRVMPTRPFWDAPNPRPT